MFMSAVLKRCLATVLVASAMAAGAQADVLSDAKARGELVVGTEFQYAPFEFLDGDKPVGFDVDLIGLIAGDLGLKVKWIDLPWASVLPALEARKFDMVVAGTTINKARLERYNFTLPIGDATVAIVKRTNDASIAKPEDMAGKTVGGMKGSSQLKSLEEYVAKLPTPAEVKVYIGSNNAYADLAAGRVSAVSGSLPNITYLAKTRPEFAVVQPAFGLSSYQAWPMRKEAESETLLAAINEGIRKYNQNGKIKELQIKWFGAEMPLPYDKIPEPNY
jgi:polar amino acid transport system substrate-binding protein